MTPEQVRGATADLDMTQAQIAEAIGVSHSHLRNVLNGQRGLSKSASILLEMLIERHSKT